MSNDQNTAHAKASVLTTLASGDNWSKLLTVLVILLSGGLNFFETKSGNELNAQEIHRANQEIHELYPRLIEALRNQNKMMEGQTRELENQATMLKKQEQALEVLQAQQKRFFGGGTEHP